MDFSGFLGNESLKNRLSASLAAGKLSHSYILSGPKGSGRKTLATILAAAMQCTSQGEKPCRFCPQCQKVFRGTHPDIITVVQPDKVKVSVDLARKTMQDMYIRPNEGKKKIYLFPQPLQEQAQNAFLKTLEEPPEYIVFLFLTERAENLLVTVRSRCVELDLCPVARSAALTWLKEKFPQTGEETCLSAWRQSAGFLGQAETLLKNGESTDPRASAIAEAFASGDHVALCKVLCKMEKLKREQLLPILRQTQALVAEALSAKAAVPAAEGPARLLASKKTAVVLLDAYRHLQQAMDSAAANVGVGSVCGYLAVCLR